MGCCKELVKQKQLIVDNHFKFLHQLPKAEMSAKEYELKEGSYCNGHYHKEGEKISPEVLSLEFLPALIKTEETIIRLLSTKTGVTLRRFPGVSDDGYIYMRIFTKEGDE